MELLLLPISWCILGAFALFFMAYKEHKELTYQNLMLGENKSYTIPKIYLVLGVVFFALAIYLFNFYNS